MPRFSVIMNVQNGAATLREAIASVLQQTFSDWELIVWDDRSTDDSAKVVGAFKDPRIRYFLSPQKTNLGRARDLAVRQARGNWLAFLDQDDIWLPHKLQKQWALAESDPAIGLVYGRTMRFSGRRILRDFDHRHEFHPLPEGDIFLNLFIDSCFICMSSAALRRSAVEELGGIPDAIETSPDYFWFVGIASKYQVRAVQEVICLYRLNSQGMTHWNGPQMQREAIWVVDQWSSRLPPALAARRRVIHSTVRAFEELCRAHLFARGLVRLFAEGSLAFLLSRPFARLFRALRRKIRRPYWKVAHSSRQIEVPAPALPEESRALVPVPPPHLRETQFPLTLSVIIVNWKVRDLLRECLRSLQQQMILPRQRWEVIVVDNDSQDGTCEMVQKEFPGVALRANHENVGFGRANNQAFQQCRGKYVLLLNPDTLVLDHAVDRLVAMLEQSTDVAALGCRLVSGDGSFQRWTGGSQPNLANVTCHFLFLNRLLPAALLPRPLYLESDPDHDLAVGWVSGACMMLRRQALAAQVFDEKFFLYCEDLDLCDRLIASGWKVVYTPSAQIVHYDGRSLETQSSEVKVSKLRSLRQVFSSKHGRVSLLLYDLVVAIGFSMRRLALGLAARLRPGQGFEGRAEKSRQFQAEALRALLDR